MLGMMLHSMLCEYMFEFQIFFLVWTHIWLYFFLLYYINSRNLNYFWCRQLCCIQYLHSVWLHIWLHYLWFRSIIQGILNTFDAEIDAASITGNSMSASSTCIQFVILHPLFLLYDNWLHWKHFVYRQQCCIQYL